MTTNTPTDQALVWTDPLVAELHHLRSVAAQRRWKALYSGDLCALHATAPEATPADLDLTRSAHTHLSRLSGALWALDTDPALAAQATALLGAASPGPWHEQDDGRLLGPTHEVAHTGLQEVDPTLLAEALAGNPGESGHNACTDDIALLEAAPKVITRLTDAVLAGLAQHSPDLQDELEVYDLQGEEDYEAAAELVADIGHWRAHSDLLGQLHCECGQVWPCPPRQRAHYHLRGHTP